MTDTTRPPYKLPPLEVARELRAAAEADILARLRRLQAETGLDLCRVEVMLVVNAYGDSDARREPRAVRIDLAV